MHDSTIFIARMMAPYLLVTGMGFFISKGFYLRMLNQAESEHPISINLSGMVHFFIGMAVLLNHLRWGHHLEIAVTLIGVAFVMKGCVLIVIPEQSMKSNKTTLKMLPLVGTGFIAAGLYLGWASFIAV